MGLLTSPLRGSSGVADWEQVAGGEEAFAEVAGDDVFRVADGGEVDTGVPAQEYIDVRRYTLELCRGEESRFLVALLLGMTKV